ncbi:MAG: nuclear transport factor 2 family protein [Burkholderiales bacterium]
MSAQTSAQTLIDLETSFWQSMINQDTDTALSLMTEPSFMVSPHGAFKFDHAAYRQMAEQGPMTVTAFELSDVEVVFPAATAAVVSYNVKQGMAPRGERQSTTQHMHDTSTWVLKGKQWQCVMHTETPIEAKPAKH